MGDMDGMVMARPRQLERLFDSIGATAEQRAQIEQIAAGRPRRPARAARSGPQRCASRAGSCSPSPRSTPAPPRRCASRCWPSTTRPAKRMHAGHARDQPRADARAAQGRWPTGWPQRARHDGAPPRRARADARRDSRCSTLPSRYSGWAAAVRPGACGRGAVRACTDR
ncbi:MAG: hypothetical protein MZW92_23845 [Comamonadaceae bacterium]|nr:hypothetical protein [Comamonadaceae bacterium]